MRGGVILIVIALFTIYLGVTGKFCCFTQFLKCAVSDSLTPCDCGNAEKTTAQATSLLPTLPQLPKLPTIPPIINSLG